jgi:hypothetical protein
VKLQLDHGFALFLFAGGLLLIALALAVSFAFSQASLQKQRKAGSLGKPCECTFLPIRAMRGIHILRAARQARVSIDREKELAMKQNVTISLDRQMIRKAKIVAARRDTSISGLLAQQIEILVGEEEEYERAERQAVALLDQGFHLGGGTPASREELHER